MQPLPRMREVELGWGKVLLVKDNGEFHALGHKCPHYGAPLVKGELSQDTREVGRDLPEGCLGPPWTLRVSSISGVSWAVGKSQQLLGHRREGLLLVAPAQHHPPPGVLSRGRVRCPWHGACFNISTGDLEDFPGLDSLHKFQVGPGGQWGGSRGVQGRGWSTPKPGPEQHSPCR